MRIKTWIVLIIIFFTATYTVLAQNDNETKKSYQKALAVVSASFKAMGGAENFNKKIEDISFTLAGSLHARNQSWQSTTPFDKFPIETKIILDLKKDRVIWEQKNGLPGGLFFANRLVGSLREGGFNLNLERKNREGRKEDGQWRFYRTWFSNGEVVLSRTYWTQVSADNLERIVEQSRDESKTWKPWVKDVFIRKSIPNLSVRNAHALVYDENLGKIFLFGGADSEKVLNDTWAFDGAKWSFISTNSPSPRTFPAMTYDSVRKKVLLFGGNRVLFGKDDNEYKFRNDFWEFDGKTWRKLDVPTPDGRAEASFIFDRQRQKAVLFGGYCIENGAIKPLSDTWEWNGKSWKKMAEGTPTARSGAAIAYDSIRKKVVLFGGGIKSGEANKTWEWDGKIWSEIKSARTEPRYNSAMVYDESRQKIVRFGGWDGTKRVSETWEYDGKIWTKLNIESPDARNHAQMVYDLKRKKIVLFGGHNGDFVFGDTWEFDGANWKKIIAVEPQKRIENGH